MKLQPMGFPLMADAWFGCVLWASKEKELCAEFTKDTGYNLAALLGGPPINQMIDKATGYDRLVVAAWCDWVTKNVWGEEGGEEPEPKE